MIATIGYSTGFTYHGLTETTATDTPTFSSMCNPHRYTVTKVYYTPPSLKELMKLWARIRMKKQWYNPVNMQPRERVLIKPVRLRCVMTGINGWANQN